MNELTKKTALLGTGLVVGAVAFTVVGASAHPGDGDGVRHQRGENVSEVLGITVDELKEAKDSGQTLEEIVTANGFDSLEAFEAAMEESLRAKLAEEGLSEEEINEKVARMQERREIKEDVRSVHETLLGKTREELREAKEAGTSFEDILAEAGYEDREAFQAATAESLTQLWVDEGVDQDTIDERLERIENRKNFRAKHKGFHEKRGF
ncbi:MAG: hypothetical protein R3313_00430 [Candidatus Saccharimonadales bacterium]|nr:hypothetical protein [Candidatus Saccharimonadales bacterium]